MTVQRTRLVSALWFSSHPGPTLMVTGLVAALAVAAEVGFWRIGLLTVAVLAGQLSVGISNDAMDARRDRSVGRTDKPIARGELGTAAAWVAALTCLLLALALSVPLGLGLLAAHAIFLAGAWSYNLGLKATALSVVPFIISFGLFPSLATLAAGAGGPAAAWAWVAGGGLGIAIHLTNALPDLDEDARTGIHGMPHRIGAGGSALVAAAAVLLGAVAATVGPHDGRIMQIPAVSWVFFGIVVAVIVVTLGLMRAGRRGRVLFRLVMLAAAVLAAQLVVSGGALAG